MSRYLSGRSRRRPQSQLSKDRDRYLSVDQAEPNLGDPSLTDVEANIPSGPQYQIVSVIGSPGKRYWIPRGGGLIPGAITVYNENTIVPNNSGISSITQLIFKGDAIKAEGYLNPDGSPGIGATITVFAPGSQGQFIINNSNEFTGVSSFFYDVTNNRIGVGTNAPTQIFDVNGNIRLRKTIYDWNNNPGFGGDVLVKNFDGGVSWANASSVITGAGGTIGQIQFHSNTGLVDGADLFYYDFVNNRVGIGSTIPRYLLDVSGISSFTGTTYIDKLNVTNLGTFNNLSVTGFSTFTQVIDANGGATIDNIRIGVAGDNEIDTSTGNLILNSSAGQVIVDDNLTVIGITSVGFITAKNAYVSGILTAVNLDFFDTVVTYLTVPGIATITNAKVTNLNVTGVATNNNLNVTTYLDVLGNANFQKQSSFNDLKVTGVSTFGNLKISVNTLSSSTGNLILDSAGTTNGVQSNDKFFVNEATESTSTITGSFRTLGGIGVVKNANIGGDLQVSGDVTLSSSGGITTTIGDLYVGGDLYTQDSLFLDDINANTGTFKVSLTTKDFTATGLSSISSLNVTGFSTFAQLIDANGGATIDNIRIGVAGDNEIDTSAGNLILDSSGGTVNVDDNLTVSGTSTFNGDVVLGNATSDTVTFNSTVSSNIIPSGTRDIGSSTILWDNIYANNFVGKVVGNAESATKLINARNFSISGDVDASVVLFDGTDDVELVTTLDTTGVAADTYGSLDGASYPRFTVDAKGRITSASNVGIAFSTATAFQSDKIKTESSTSINDHFLTFVADNNTTPGSTYESLYTNAGIFYKPSTNLLSLGNLTVSGISTFNGDVVLGNATSDTVTFNSTVSSNIIPSGVRDLGSNSVKWNNVYANNFVGKVVGIADSATNLFGGTAGDIPYQTAPNTTAFLADPGSAGNGYVLTWNNTSTAPQWSDLNNLPGAGYTIDVIQTGGDDLDPAIRLTDGTTNDDITIVGGANVTVTRNSNSQLTIAAVAGAGLAPDVTISDLINVTGGTISADDPGADRIFFWDDSQSKATHLSLGTGLEISGTTLSATSAAGKTYNIEVPTGTTSLRLTDGTTNDDIAIVGGANVTVTRDSESQLSISAAASKTYNIEVPTGTTSLRLTDGTTNDDITLSAGSNMSLTRISDSEIQFSVASENTSNYTFTSVDKILSNYEYCTVKANGLTITLPSGPSIGFKVTVVIAGNYNNTTINGNGNNIMGLPQNLTIDIPYSTVTFTFIDPVGGTTQGWWAS